MNGMTWKGLNDLSKNLNDLALSVVLPKIAVPIFFVFSLLALLRFFFSKADYINEYFNIILNYIATYKNVTIIGFSIILTLWVKFKYKIHKPKFNILSVITIFIFMFGLLTLFTQLFFNI